MGRVFISYSRKDSEALDQLRRFVDPLRQAGRLDVWYDQRIEKGDNWQDQTDDALRSASVAVLLVSQDFLASQFVSTKELPVLLDRYRAGALTLLPVFLRHSNVQTVQPELAVIQGYGSPEEPLSEQSRQQRERVYKELSERLLALAGAPAAVTPAPARRPAPGPAPPATSYELTVVLQREGADLVRRYRLPGQEPFLTTASAWREVEGMVKPMVAALDANDIESVRNHRRTAPEHWGKLLFDVLFGTDAKRHETILRTAFHQPLPTPQPTAVRAPLRLRVATSSAELSGLPWRLTSWEDRPLIHHGWVFSSGISEDPDADQVTAVPSEVLLVGAKDEAGAAHLEAVEATLRAIWPSKEPFTRRVHTVAQLDNALQGQRPHFVYVCTALAVRSARPCLILDGAQGQEGLALDDLARRFRDSPRPPAVLCLNTHGTTIFDPASVFAAGVPLVIWRRLSQQTGDSPDVAIRWLSAWLREGLDPVDALHRISSDKAFADSPEAQTLAVYANYRHWRTDMATSSAVRERMAHLRLDREKQKGIVAKWVGELAASDTLRVITLVPYSEPGNRLEDVQEQLCHHLDLALDDRVAIKRVRLEFPRSRTALRRDLEWELSLQLEADEGEGLAHLLQRLAPRATVRRRPMLWLHWGIFGDNPNYQHIKGADLEEWLAFTGTFIPQHCPANLRVVCSLAIETTKDRHVRLVKLLNDKHRELDDPKYWLRILEPIGGVAENELFDYLKDERSGCSPPQIRSELAQRLTAKTSGEFESLVTLIEQAEASSFHALLSSLRREQGDATKAEELEF